MIKRIVSFWFGLVLSYGAIDIILHGFYSLNFRNPLGTKVLAIIILIIGVYLIFYTFTPKSAIKISNSIFKRNNV
jgi:divalent metal cation (Fe/Co/Zn/Cd) transporter